jgi:hypothetical protein
MEFVWLEELEVALSELLVAEWLVVRMGNYSELKCLCFLSFYVQNTG